MKKIVILLLFIIAGPAQAKYVQTCKVKYMTNDGWSKVYEVTVTFMRGLELNKSLKSRDYLDYETYGIIFWADDQVSTIKLNEDKGGGLSGSRECTYDDFHGLLDRGYVEGIDLEKRKWKICYDYDCSY